MSVNLMSSSGSVSVVLPWPSSVNMFLPSVIIGGLCGRRPTAIGELPSTSLPSEREIRRQRVGRQLRDRAAADRQAEQAAVVAGVRELLELRLVDADADVERLSGVGTRVALEERRHRDRGGRGRRRGRAAAIARRAAGLHAAEQAEREAVGVRGGVAAGDLVEIDRAGGARREPAEQRGAARAARRGRAPAGTGCPPCRPCSCTRSRTAPHSATLPDGHALQV